MHGWTLATISTSLGFAAASGWLRKAPISAAIVFVTIGYVVRKRRTRPKMSYGADTGENFKLAADYVARVLKGAKPSDLPVEQPNRYFLVINLKTAKALGLTIPQSLLLRADDVIQNSPSRSATAGTHEARKHGQVSRDRGRRCAGDRRTDGGIG